MGQLNSKTNVSENNNQNHTINFRPQSTICQVNYKNQSGTGALYKFEFPEGTWRTLFITSYQVLKICDLNEIVDICLYFDFATSEFVDVTPDMVKWLWTSPVDQLNVTVIEFSITALNVLSQMNFAFLYCATPIVNENFTLLEIEDCWGKIVNVTNEKIKFKIKTDNVVSGSPLFNEKFNVIGIYTGQSINSSKKARAAVNLRYVIDEYQKFVQNQLGYMTEDEFWLAKIDSIPTSEFQLIGSGGYGDVYKIDLKIKNTLNEFAVKILSGFEGFLEHEVKELKKEYSIITSLDYHSRIIQFFALIRDERNARLMILMEYLEGGSLADKLKDENPLDNKSIRKYFVQILEGVDFLHQHSIFHSDIKPAYILFTQYDNLKICDFGIAVEKQTKSSLTSSRVKGTLYYMSPERLRGEASRSAKNDIWSVGATFVQMLSGKRLNYEDKSEWKFRENIVSYQLFIDGKPFNEYIETLTVTDFKEILSRTLCVESKRARVRQLLSIARPLLPRRIPQKSNLRLFKILTNNDAMCYNSARDELFIVKSGHFHTYIYTIHIMRVMSLSDTSSYLRDVYRGTAHEKSPTVSSVCHLSNSDALLVCSREKGPSGECAYWLVVLSRRESSEWREEIRLPIKSSEKWPLMCCALSDSRALVGFERSITVDLFRVQSGAPNPLAHIHRLAVPENCRGFSATCGSETLVATSHADRTVRVHRLRRNRMEPVACIRSQNARHVLWVDYRLLVEDQSEPGGCTSAVTEFEWSGTRLERRCELIVHNESIWLKGWCAVENGVAIFDANSFDIVHYVFV